MSPFDITFSAYDFIFTFYGNYVAVLYCFQDSEVFVGSRKLFLPRVHLALPLYGDSIRILSVSLGQRTIVFA